MLARVNAAGAISVQTTEETSRYLGFTKGRIVFVGKPLREVVPDGVMRQRRLAQVPLREMADVQPVPNRQRLVETVVRLERSNDGGVAGGLLTEIRRDGIARHELRQREDDERDADRE